MKSKEKSKNNPTNQWFKVDSDMERWEPITHLMDAHGTSGYGLFMLLLGRLRRSPTFEMSINYKVHSKSLQVKEKLMRSVIEDFGLFVVDHKRGVFYSEELSDSLQKIEEISRINSENGKKGAEVTNKKRKISAANADTYEGTATTGESAIAAAIRQEENIKEEIMTEEIITDQSIEETAAGAVATDDDFVDVSDIPTTSSFFCPGEELVADRGTPVMANPAAELSFDTWFKSFPFDTSKIHSLPALVATIQKEWETLPSADKARCVEHTAQYAGELSVVQPLFYLRDRLFEKPPSAWAKPRAYDSPPYNNRSTDRQRQSMAKAYTENDLEKPFVIKNKIIEC